MNKVEEVEALLNNAQKELDEMEYESAPSGEFTDYNHDIIVQEVIVATLEEVINILKG